jgi:transcriptional regulator with XRE-family HTH domain
MTRKTMEVTGAMSEVLRAARTARGLKQSDVATVAGVHYKTISQIETGTVGRTKIGHLERLVKLYGMTLQELVDRAQPKSAVVAPTAAPVTQQQPYRGAVSFSFGYGSVLGQPAAPTAPSKPAAPTADEQLSKIIQAAGPVLALIPGIKDLPAVRTFAAAGV